MNKISSLNCQGWRNIFFTYISISLLFLLLLQHNKANTKTKMKAWIAHNPWVVLQTDRTVSMATGYGKHRHFVSIQTNKRVHGNWDRGIWKHLLSICTLALCNKSSLSAISFYFLKKLRFLSRSSSEEPSSLSLSLYLSHSLSVSFSVSLSLMWSVLIISDLWCSGPHGGNHTLCRRSLYHEVSIMSCSQWLSLSLWPHLYRLSLPLSLCLSLSVFPSLYFALTLTLSLSHMSFLS